MYTLFVVTLLAGVAIFLADFNNDRICFGPDAGDHFDQSVCFPARFGRFVGATGRGFNNSGGFEAALVNLTDPACPWDLAALEFNGTHLQERRWLFFLNGTAAELPVFFTPPAAGLFPAYQNRSGEDQEHFTVANLTSFFLSVWANGTVLQRFGGAGSSGGVDDSSSTRETYRCHKGWDPPAVDCVSSSGPLSSWVSIVDPASGLGITSKSAFFENRSFAFASRGGRWLLAYSDSLAWLLDPATLAFNFSFNLSGGSPLAFAAPRDDASIIIVYEREVVLLACGSRFSLARAAGNATFLGLVGSTNQTNETIRVLCSDYTIPRVALNLSRAPDCSGSSEPPGSSESGAGSNQSSPASPSASSSSPASSSRRGSDVKPSSEFHRSGSNTLAALAALSGLLLLLVPLGAFLCWRLRSRRQRGGPSSDQELCVVLAQPAVRFDPPLLDLAAASQTPVRSWQRLKVALLNETAQSALVSFAPVDTGKLRLRPVAEKVKVGAVSYVDFELDLWLSCTTAAQAELKGAGDAAPCLAVSCAGQVSTYLDAAELAFEEQLGQGGFGVVWAGTWRGSRVAIKKSLVDLATAGPVYQAEWEKETDILRRLRSPFIVGFVGSTDAPGCCAIVTELAPHGSLAAYIRKHPGDFGPELKRLMLADVCEGLIFLHGNSMVHRDIKPDNALVFSVSAEPTAVRCKLTDFGTSRDVGRDSACTTKGVGTPLYLAPEILRGERYGTPADVYSFGVLVYAVAAQRDPYSEFTELASQWKLSEAILAGRRPTFPEAGLLADLAAACWADTPESRPSSAQARRMLG